MIPLVLLELDDARVVIGFCSYLLNHRYGKVLEKQQKMLLFLSYLNQSIQALSWTIRSRVYSAVIKLDRSCVCPTFMQLSWLCMVGCFIVKISDWQSFCKIKTYTKTAKIWQSSYNNGTKQVTIIVEIIRPQFMVSLSGLSCFFLRVCCASWALCLGVGNKNPFKVQVLSVGRWQCLVCQRWKWQWKLSVETVLDSDHGFNSLVCAWGSGCCLETWCGQQARYGEELVLLKSELMVLLWKQIAFVMLRQVRCVMDLIWNGLLNIQIQTLKTIQFLSLLFWREKDWHH